MENRAVIESHQAAAELFDRTVDSYQRRADTRVYNASSFIFARRKEIVCSMIDPAGPNATVVDFGMGPGVFSAELVNRGYHCIGIDLSAAMVERARALGLPNSTFIQGDLDTLNAYRGTADLVMAIGLIDYLEDPTEGLSRLAACAKPSGAILVSFRNRRAISTWLRDLAKVVWRKLFRKSQWRSDSAFVSSVHEHAFSARTDLKPVLRELGFNQFEVQYMDFSPFFFNFPVPKFLWRTWCVVDRVLAGSITRWGCSTGVLKARRVR